MSSEQLADGVNPLDAELAATWDLLKGYSGRDTDLGIARRFGGAEAAYSLRDIGAMNGSVVNVRREPHDDDNPGVTDETDFSAHQVQSGVLEDWVNGKLESTLPADVDTAAAAYSLRKVKDNYTGNAVRIRRETDDVEVDVAFDSDNKVSTSSAITNTTEEGGEIGSTSETTLGNFLTETTNVSKSYDHSQDPTSAQNVYVTVGRFGSSNPVLYDGNTNSDSLPTIPDGARYASKWTATNPLYGFKVGDSYNGATYDIEFDILQKTGTENVRFANTNFMELYPHANIIEGSLGSGQTFTTKDSWVHFKMRLRTGRGNNGAFLIRSNDTSVQTTWYIANLTMTPTVDSSAYVHTWYDQAGSNNAVQDTARYQPEIANDGALLDGILFDNGASGTGGIHLQANSMTTGSATDNFVSAVIDRNSLSSSNMGAIISTRSGNFDGFTYGIHSNGYPQIFYTGNGNYSVSSEILATSGKILLSFDKDSTVGTIHKNATTPTPSSNTLSGYGNSSDVFNIGTINRPTLSPSNGFMGLMSEVIVYNSDQASNRFLIESNINNYYGLYNDANEFSTSTWQNGGTGSNDSWDSLTNSSTDGFVASTSNGSGSTENAVCSLNFARVVPNNGRVFVSFNLEFGGTAVELDSKKVRVQLRDSSGNIANDVVQPADGGDGGTQFRICNQGFNSVAYTVNSSTASNLEFLLEVGNGRTGNMTVTDLKVSRIARNGFVETWYDQSDNDNDAVQATATEQPSVVKNGGIVKLNGKPSVDFDGVDNYLTFTDNFNFNLDPISVSRPINTIMFVGENTAGARSFIGDKGSTKNWIAAPYNGKYQFRDNGSTIYDTTVSATLGSQLVLSIQCPSEDNFSIRENGSAKTVGGTNNISAAIGIRDIGAGYTLSGNTNYQTMKAQEFYFHKERFPNDIVDLENDAINYYNIS